MNIARIRTRTDLLEMVRQDPPVRAIKRAIDDTKGEVEAIGGFSATPPYDLPSYIIRVTSRHGRTWIIAILVDQHTHGYRNVLIDEIPWRHWDGDAQAKEWTLLGGDQPSRYARIASLVRRNIL